MLTLLKIQNLALVDELAWEIGDGLVGVTGETGAGKSVIVGGVKLILGERADRNLIRTGASSCIVEATFRLGNEDEVNAFLEDHGFEPCEDHELLLKRVFSATGNNKQFINCSPATLGVLKELGNMLVDLHGPHDHQSLLSCERQLSLLDAHAGAETVLSAYRQAYRKWKAAVEELDELRNSERANEQEIDLLRFQVNEIESAQLQPGEEESLEQRYRLSFNSSRLLESSGEILEHLSGGNGGGGVMARLTEVQRAIRDLETMDSGVSKITQGFASAQLEIEELERGLRDYASGLETDPAELVRLERRVDQLETLKRKYGNSVEEIHAFGETAAAKLKSIESRGDELERLEAGLANARAGLEKSAAKLTQIRRRAAPKLAREISVHLGDLGFERSAFEVSLTAEASPTIHGMESVEFLFSPNPGEPSKPLRIIASSGEMSRVMLAVKSALAEQDAIPLMIFDEIDANVGGEIAHSVGRKMASLGERHQVVSITHLPQVAAVADYHYVVQKEIEGEKTRSLLRKVEGESRIAEIARMLGGGGEPELALAGNLLAGSPSK
jgi:DNA repair protein RecN (Recombination protein N)